MMLRSLLWLLVLATASAYGASKVLTLDDESRRRTIPIGLNFPDKVNECALNQPCPVAFISSGYGVKHFNYSFITEQLVDLGYLVVTIQHELDGDPPLSRERPFIKTRHENWQRGAVTLAFVRQTLKSQFNGYNFDHLILIGHSNGGDISALYSQEHSDLVKILITLDHRRMPLPRDESIDVLTIRAGDFPADEGVLLTPDEQAELGGCQVKLDTARHNDMTDYGPAWLKQSILSAIDGYLRDKSCYIREMTNS